MISVPAIASAYCPCSEIWSQNSVPMSQAWCGVGSSGSSIAWVPGLYPTVTGRWVSWSPTSQMRKSRHCGAHGVSGSKANLWRAWRTQLLLQLEAGGIPPLTQALPPPRSPGFQVVRFVHCPHISGELPEHPPPGRPSIPQPEQVTCTLSPT